MPYYSDGSSWRWHIIKKGRQFSLLCKERILFWQMNKKTSGKESKASHCKFGLDIDILIDWDGWSLEPFFCVYDNKHLGLLSCRCRLVDHWLMPLPDPSNVAHLVLFLWSNSIPFNGQACVLRYFRTWPVITHAGVGGFCVRLFGSYFMIWVVWIHKRSGYNRL